MACLPQLFLLRSGKPSLLGRLCANESSPAALVRFTYFQSCSFLSAHSFPWRLFLACSFYYTTVSRAFSFPSGFRFFFLSRCGDAIFFPPLSFIPVCTPTLDGPGMRVCRIWSALTSFPGVCFVPRYLVVFSSSDLIACLLRGTSAALICRCPPVDRLNRRCAGLHRERREATWSPPAWEDGVALAGIYCLVLLWQTSLSNNTCGAILEHNPRPRR